MDAATRTELREIAIEVVRTMGPVIGREATIHTLTRLGFELEGPNAMQKVQEQIAWVRDAHPVWPRVMAMLEAWEKMQEIKGNVWSNVASNVISALLQGAVILIGLGIAAVVAHKAGVM
jgi:hypothetical protein